MVKAFEVGTTVRVLGRSHPARLYQNMVGQVLESAVQISRVDLTPDGPADVVILTRELANEE